MTLKHCQPRQKEASTAVETTCKHTKHTHLNKSVQHKSRTTPRIIISSTVGDKSATTNQNCNFPFVTLKAFTFGPLLTPTRGSRINAAIFKIIIYLVNSLLLFFLFFSLAKFTYPNTLVGFGLLTHTVKSSNWPNIITRN
jgi:hypothetical protein